MLTLPLNESFYNINGDSIKTDCVLPNSNGPLSNLATSSIFTHDVINFKEELALTNITQ